MTSASTGFSKGIQLLSNINMWLAVILMLFVLLTGPTVSLFGGFVNAVGDYSSSRWWGSLSVSIPTKT